MQHSALKNFWQNSSTPNLAIQQPDIKSSNKPQGSPMEVDNSFDQSPDNNIYIKKNQSPKKSIDVPSMIPKLTTKPKIDNLLSNVNFKTPQLRKKSQKPSNFRNLVANTPSESLIHIDSRKSNFCSFRNAIYFLLFLFSALSAILLYFGDPFIVVNQVVQHNNIKLQLKESVLNQDDAVIIVSTSLEQQNHWTKKMKVLPFIGSSGVGKTHVSNILKKNFFIALIQEIIWNEDINPEEISKNFKSCCLNLLIIDDLTVYKLDEVIKFLELLPTTVSVLAIPIFSVQHTNKQLEQIIRYEDYRAIELGFDQSKLYHEIVLFNEMNRDDAEVCLKRLVKDQKKEENINLIKTIVKDHDIKYQGLKGLHSKLYVQ